MALLRWTWMAAACVLLLWLGCCPAAADPGEAVGGLFSWEQEAALDEAEELFSLMERYGLSELYQSFPAKAPIGKLTDFLEQARQRGIRVYLLDGNAQWAREAKGSSLRKAIKRVAKWNERMPEGVGFSGIMADVEPYLLKEWDDERRDALMQTYARGMCAAYQRAQEQGLEMLVCIPFFYDTSGCSSVLEALAEAGCDGFAVMNYFRQDEAGQISGEAEIAQRFGRRLITIYELQEPGDHGLTEKHTYYNAGMDALMESYRRIGDAFSPQRVDIALHCYPGLETLVVRTVNDGCPLFGLIG